jgi:hypothetical protein
MIQRANPEWITNPGPMPELPAAPVIALLLALVERDNSIEEAITRRNPYKITLNQGLREATRQLQARLEAARSSPPQNA